VIECRRHPVDFRVLDAHLLGDRASPYSPAAKLTGMKFRNATPQIAFVNDLEEPGRQPDFW
jgi:hypothetical protein